MGLLNCFGIFDKNNKVHQKRNSGDISGSHPKIEVTSPSPRKQESMRITGIRGEYFSTGSTFSHFSFYYSTGKSIDGEKMDDPKIRANEQICKFISMKLGK